MKTTKEIIKQEQRLAEYQGEDRIISSHELKAEIDLLPPSPKYYTEIKQLDDILEGVEGGELIVVTGPTGAGKTTILQTMTVLIGDKIPTAWYSFELTHRQFLTKFTSTLPLFYLPKKNTDTNVQWLIERIIEAKVKYDVKFIFIDHLHYILSLDRYNGKNMSLELGDIVTKIKQIAIEYELVIFLVAHGTDHKESISREPKMTDVRDSGMIIRLADTVMGVWRIPNKYNGTETTVEELGKDDTKSKVRVWKNRRNGKLDYFLMDYQGGLMKEIEHDPNARPPLSKVEKFTNKLKGIDDNE